MDILDTDHLSLKYRMYVDEVGNSDMGESTNNPNNRHLSLTGVIMELQYVSDVVFPTIESLKNRFFDSHPDDPVILHRKELVNKKHPFESLRDPVTEHAFNTELLSLLTTLNYVVVTVVIDKHEHWNRYQVWRFDPYHYCLTILVERFVMWLRTNNTRGDVMAESRGGKEDKRLKDSFERIYDQGTDFMRPDQFAECLTSKQLKVKTKSNNVVGLQIADLIAHPSYRITLARRNGEVPPANFGGQVARILEDLKYNRNACGKIDGWGRKWLP